MPEMMAMDIEEIDDNSSQEDCPPAPTTATAAKKRPRGKSKKEAQSPAVASSTSTLTRFLGPAGPPSLSAWEDVNRQCPVCQQTGFSSRSLALHVNDCLDVGSNAGAGARAVPASDEGEVAGSKETAKKGVGNAGGRNAPALGSGSGRRAGNAGTSNATHAAGAGTRQGEGGARTTPQAVPSKSKAPASNGQAAKKAKTQKDGRGTGAERQRPDCGQATDKARSGTSMHTTILQPSLPGSNQSPAGVAQQQQQQHQHQQQQQQQQPTPLRRRGLGLARPTRGQPTGSDAAPTPTNAAAAAVSRVRNGSDERVLNDIARSQLSYVLEASASTQASKAGGWLGTQLFPKPVTEDRHRLMEHQCADCCCNGAGGGQGVCLARRGANACANESSRVRARPASWGARPSSGRRGWLGMWPGGLDDGNGDDCWGDGDGYVTLSPFPSLAEPTTAGQDVQDAQDASVGIDSANGKGNSLVLSSKGQGGSPAPTWRADRFLQVFARLQPARRALNLHESPPPSPKPKTKPKAKTSEARCAEVEGAGVRLAPKVAAGHGDIDGGSDADDGDDAGRDGRQDAVSPGRKGSMTASPVVEREKGKGMARAGGGGTAGSREIGSVGKLAASLPKRAALGTLPLPSPGSAGSSVVDQRSSANIANVNIVPDRSRAVSPSLSAHCSSLGPSSASVKSSLNKGKVSRKGPPMPPTPSSTQAVPPTSKASEVRESRGVGCLASKSNPMADPKGSSKQKALPEAAASVAPTSTSHRTGIMSTENLATSVNGASKRPKPAAVTGAQLNTPARAGGQPPPRNGSSGNGGRTTGIGRLAGPSATVQQASASRESHTCKGARTSTLTSTSSSSATSTADEGGEPQARARARAGVKHAAPAAGRWGGARSRGPLACRASSGLLRSTDLAASSASASLAGVAEPKLAPVASGGFVDPSKSDASQQRQRQRQEQEQEQETCQGRKADVPQKGSLTVVCDHGATLRSSWSIDDSREVGRLVCGASLGYDSVWYLDPADDDCVGVLRYRILPHPLLAPTGGWISERGRLRDDPYTILNAIPSPTSTSASPSSSAASSWNHNAPSDRRNRREAGETQTQTQAPLGRRHPAARHQRQPQQQQRQEQGTCISENEGRARSTSTHGSTTNKNVDRGVGRGGIRYPSRESHGERAAAAPPTAPPPSSSSSNVGGGRRTQQQPRAASKALVLAGASPGRGRGSSVLGASTSPSAKALEASDTGDKVTCPVCNRGMDHWKSGQRQQHVHTCLLQQSSSAKKAPPPAKPATAAATPAPRTPGNDHDKDKDKRRYAGAGGSGYGNRSRGGVGETWPSVLGPGQGQDGRTDADAVDSPRSMSTRVSLQGVFSPQGGGYSTFQPARGQHGTGHSPSRSEHRRDRDRDRDRGRGRGRESSSRRPSACAASPRKGTETPTSTPTPTRRSGAGFSLAMKTNGFGASGGPAQVRLPANKSTAAPKAPKIKGPAECPVCQLHFGGRLADWERQQHIQQCLESLEGVFDSEE